MGEIHEALRRANRVSGGLQPTPEPRPRPHDPEILEAYREMAAAPVAAASIAPAQVVAACTEKRGRWQSREVIVDGRGAASESLRHLALRLRRDLAARRSRSVAVLSALREEGKTTLACNLALALASLDADRGVALVDLDLRRPQVAASFELRGGAGVEDVLAGRSQAADVCVSLDVPPLDVYPALRGGADVHRVLSQPVFPALVRELESRYEVVVFDTPPVLLVPDSLLILESVDSAIAVGRSGKSTRGALEAMCKMLPPGRLIGAVLNEGTLPVPSGSYGYYTADGDPER